MSSSPGCVEDGGVEDSGEGFLAVRRDGVRCYAFLGLGAWMGEVG